MGSLVIELSPEVERRLEAAAGACGQAVSDYARALLEERLVPVVGDSGGTGDAPAENPWAGLPRRSPEELDAIALEQGAPLGVRFDDLLGDFWPEDESAEEFTPWLRESRREGV